MDREWLNGMLAEDPTLPRPDAVAGLAEEPVAGLAEEPVAGRPKRWWRRPWGRWIWAVVVKGRDPRLWAELEVEKER